MLPQFQSLLMTLMQMFSSNSSHRSMRLKWLQTHTILLKYLPCLLSLLLIRLLKYTDQLQLNLQLLSRIHLNSLLNQQK